MTIEPGNAERPDTDWLYDQYGKPLEADHWGEYVAIAWDGRTLLGSEVHDLVNRAVDAFGPNYTIYKVGPRAAWKFR
jgi:hypothetical protein